MKVIDLLNKIAKGEEVPEIIKVMGVTYYLCEGDLSGCCYFSEEQGFGGLKLSFDTSVMNYEVDIIEDTPKEDKKLEKMEFCYEVSDKMQNANNERFKDFINEIIDKVNGE